MWSRLEKWHNNLEAKMTKARYLEMCAQTGREPDPDKCPPDENDFPYIVQRAIEVFNMLGDRVASDIGYLGKDYTLLPVHMDEFIDDKQLFLEIIAWLDSKLIKKSSEEMKRARDEAKRKSKH